MGRYLGSDGRKTSTQVRIRAVHHGLRLHVFSGGMDEMQGAADDGSGNPAKGKQFSQKLPAIDVIVRVVGNDVRAGRVMDGQAHNFFCWEPS